MTAESDDPFCIAPFTTLSLYTTGDVTFCCKNPTVLGNVRDAPLGAIWNAEPLARIRADLLAGRRTPSCAHCWAVEAQDRESSWRATLNARAGPDLPAIRAEADRHGPRRCDTPRYFEVSLSNLCNLRCRMCSPELSSSLAAVWDRLGGAGAADNPRLVTSYPAFADMEKDFAPIAEALDHIFIYGGEPLVDPAVAKLVNMLLPRRDSIDIALNTNLTHLGEGGLSLLETLAGFRRCDVSVSIDGWRGLNEHIRSGTRSGKLETNLRTLRAALPQIRLAATVTPQALNILHWAETIDYIVEVVSPVHLNSSLLVNEPHLSVQVLPDGLKEIARDRIARFNADLLPSLRLDAALDRGKVAAIGDNAVAYMTSRNAKPADWRRFCAAMARADALFGGDTLAVVPEFRPYWVAA